LITNFSTVSPQPLVNRRGGEGLAARGGWASPSELCPAPCKLCWALSPRRHPMLLPVPVARKDARAMVCAAREHPERGASPSPWPPAPLPRRDVPADSSPKEGSLVASAPAAKKPETGMAEYSSSVNSINSAFRVLKSKIIAVASFQSLK